MFRVVSTSASDCLERLVSEMTYYVLSGTLNSTHSLAHSLPAFVINVVDCPISGPDARIEYGTTLNLCQVKVNIVLYVYLYMI